MIFPINNFLSLFEKSGSVRITFNAKNEEVLFMHIFQHRSLLCLYTGRCLFIICYFIVLDNQ